MSEEPGHLNSRPLLDECADAIVDMVGDSDLYSKHCAKLDATEVLAVLRRRGLLNEAGIALCRAEIGDRK